MGFWGFGAIMMYGAGMGDSDHHTPVNLPTVLAGGGCGRLQGGRHVQYPRDYADDEPGIDLLDKVGVEVQEIADSTGRLNEL